MSGGFFRKAAIERLSSPEQLDQLMQVTAPKGWLALAGFSSLLVIVLIWAVYGTLEVTETAQGILIRGSGIRIVEATRSGQIASLDVRAGDVIERGQQIATILPPMGRNPVPITSTHAGRILETQVNEGSVIQTGEPLFSLELIAEELQAILYLDTTQVQAVQPGMRVFLSPVTVPKEEFGILFGRVTSIGAFPVTYQGMLRVLGSDALVQSLSGSGVKIEVRVGLIKANTPTGYQWSSGDGPPFTIQSGTLFTGNILVEEQRPIDLIWGSLH